MKASGKPFPWFSLLGLIAAVYLIPRLWSGWTKAIEDFHNDLSGLDASKAGERVAELSGSIAMRQSHVSGEQDTSIDTAAAYRGADYFNPTPQLMVNDPCGVASMGGVVDRVIEGSPWGQTWHIKVLSVTDYQDISMENGVKGCRVRVLMNGGTDYFDFSAFIENGLPFWRGHWTTANTTAQAPKLPAAQ